MTILFTILLPVHRNADLIPYAIKSVLAQTIQDFELFIICDGAPSDTIVCAHLFAKEDSRINVFSFPKGERHGEAYRHIALQHAKGNYIAHIADDDLWFPNHLEEMSKLLQDVDFGNVTACLVDPNDENNNAGLCGDLHNSDIVQRMISTPFNFFGFTTAGYTMAAYRRLPQGWSPAPNHMWTDLYMWRKFLLTPGLIFGTRITVTAFQFPAPLRTHLSPLDRKLEIEKWFVKMQCQKQRDQWSQKILKKLQLQAYLYEMNQSKLMHYDTLKAEHAALNNEIHSIYHSLSWRITNPLRQVAYLAKKWFV